MRLLIFPMMLLMAGPLSACANLSDDPDGGTGGTGGSGWQAVPIGCTNNINTELSLLDWELRVSPQSIESGEPFTATLDGVAVFSEAFFDAAQDSVPGGVKEVNAVDLKATVHVREGTTGDDDVVLVLDPIEYPYRCKDFPTACNPGHDLTSVPGRRGNTDCQPENPSNPCGRFISLPIDNDCGTCAGLGEIKADQCDAHGFCVVGGKGLELKEETGRYTAGTQGNVLFGWDDESTGATLQEGGPNDGTWNLPAAVYEDPAGPIGIRVTIGGLTVALECTMGVDCIAAPDNNCVEALTSPAPDSELISFEIKQP